MFCLRTMRVLFSPYVMMKCHLMVALEEHVSSPKVSLYSITLKWICSVRVTE